MNRTKALIVGIGVLLLVMLASTILTFRFATVHGNEMGVKETWFGGVESTPYQPGTHLMFPGWSQHMYTYDMSSQVFIMNDLPSHIEKVAKGREKDAYKVQSAEGQDMWVSLNVRWRIDPEKIVDLHKTVRNEIEEKIVRTTVMKVVNQQATIRHAIDAYSGEGLVKLQADIYRDLTASDGELRNRGIIVENFVIEGIRLDEKYIGEIRSRQVATQQKLRADEETKAAQAVALKAQAEAKADYNRRVVEAERDKAVGILKAEEDKQKKVLSAEADAAQVLLAAEADKKKVVLAAEGEKESGILNAQAIEAIGKAKADAAKQMFAAWANPGAEQFARVEVSKQVAEAFKGIKGWLPSDMKINLISDSFMQSVKGLMGEPHAMPAVPVPATK